MKKFLALTLTLVMVLSLAACGGKKETPAAPAEENKESAAAQTEIVWWAFPTFGVDSGYEQELADAFMAANPDVKITVETIDFQSGPDALTSAITAGTAPDILFDAPGRIIEYGNAGNLVALDDMIADLKSDLSSESLLETCVGADGSYYMYPISSSPFYMGLNKEMLEKADALQYVNLEGDRTWTTENFVKMCEALRDAGVCMTPGIVYCGAQGGDQGTRALVNNLYSGKFTSADHQTYTADSAENKKALQQLVDWSNAGLISYDASFAAADELQLFANGTIAMSFCWNASNQSQYASSVTFTPMPVVFPSDDGVPELCGGIWGFGIFDNGDANRAAAAKEFIKFVCDDSDQAVESVRMTGFFPVRASLGDVYAGTADEDRMNQFSGFMKYLGDYYNVAPAWAEQRTEWWNMLQRCFMGTPVDESVQTYVDNCNAAIAASKA